MLGMLVTLNKKSEINSLFNIHIMTLSPLQKGSPLVLGKKITSNVVPGMPGRYLFNEGLQKENLPIYKSHIDKLLLSSGMLKCL